MTSGSNRVPFTDAAQHEFNHSLHILIDQIPASLAMLDLNLCYLAMSRQWKLDFDLGEGNFVGVSHYEVFPDIPEHWRAINRHALAGEKSNHDAVLFEKPNGELQWLRWEICPWHTAGGDIGGILLYNEDLTASKNKDAALRENTEKFAAIVGCAMDAIIGTDENGTVTVFNPAAEAMFLCTRDAAMGAPLTTFMPASFRPSHTRNMHRFATTTGESKRLMGRLRVATGLRRNGEEFMLEASISHVSTSKEVLFLAVLRDVSERARNEDALRQSRAALAEASRTADNQREQERARIAREIHDDLSQTLYALKIDIQSVGGMGMLDSSDERKSSTLRRMLKSINHAVEAAQRISTGQRPIVIDELGLVGALKWLAEQFTERTGLRCDFQADSIDFELQRPQAMALFRTLQESLNNIAKHAQATQVEVTLQAVTGHIVLKVNDNGIGFDPLAPRKRESFGLARMRERAHLLNAHLAIKSAPGDGTMVEVRIPVP